MTVEQDKIKPPQKDFANHLHEYFNQSAKTITGGFLNPLIDIVIPSFHQKQFENWCSEVYNALLELENKKLSIEQLRTDLEFVSLLKESILIASKNHQIDKLTMLKTGLLNSLSNPISFDSKLLFTRLIENLGLSHHIILKALSKRLSEFCNLKNYGDIFNLFIKYYPDLSINKDELIYFLKDLDENRLIKLSKDIEDDEIVKEASRLITGYGKNNNLPFIAITDFGERYLEYILE